MGVIPKKGTRPVVGWCTGRHIMAQSFPAISAQDNQPKSGQCTVILTTPGLKVSKSVLGKAKPQNTTVDAQEFTEDSVHIQVTVKCKDSEPATYIYKRNTPESIKKDKTKVEFCDKQIRLTLVKEKSGSWASFCPYLAEMD